MDTLNINILIAQILYTYKELSKIIQIFKTIFKDILHDVLDRNLIRDECLSETVDLYDNALLLGRERNSIKTIQDIVANLLILIMNYFSFIFSRYFVTKWVVRRRHKPGMYLLDFALE